ncbi:hypothetical protein LTR95_010128 [Oleoguttula sp. CCFEE 5521]
MAAQALATTEDLATTSAIMIFFQTMGGAIFVSAAQSSFSNSLLSSAVLRSDPSLVQTIFTTGATQLKYSLKAGKLAAVIAAYIGGLSTTFVMALVLVAVSLLVAPLSPWVNVKGKVPVGMA